MTSPPFVCLRLVEFFSAHLNPLILQIAEVYLKDPKSVMRCPFSDCPTATYLRFPEPPM